MFDWLKRAFRGPTPRLDRWGFEPCQSVVLLALPPGHAEGVDATKLTKEEFLALARSAAKAIKERESISPFHYQGPGGVRLPVFTGPEQAGAFVSALIKSGQRGSQWASGRVSG